VRNKAISQEISKLKLQIANNSCTLAVTCTNTSTNAAGDESTYGFSKYIIKGTWATGEEFTVTTDTYEVESDFGARIWLYFNGMYPEDYDIQWSSSTDGSYGNHSTPTGVYTFVDYVEVGYNTDTTTTIKTKANCVTKTGIDTVLSENSENPVQNKVITAAINGNKTSFYGICTSSTENDAKEVTIDGVTALKEGMDFYIYFDYGNHLKAETAITLNINDLGARTVTFDGVDGFESYNSISYGCFHLIYTNDTFVLANSIAMSSNTADYSNTANVARTVHAGSIGLPQLTDSLKTYSTTPQKIGSWTDGTPIWRVAFKYTLTDDDKNSLASSDEIDLCNYCKTISNTSEYCLYLKWGATIISGDTPCVIDDINLTPVSNTGCDVDTSQITADYVQNAGATYICGWIEFVTPESNLTS